MGPVAHARPAPLEPQQYLELQLPLHLIAISVSPGLALVSMAPVSSAQLAPTPQVAQQAACCVPSARLLPQAAIPPATASVMLMGESAPDASYWLHAVTAGQAMY
jgi:hypothetical protein